MHGQWIKNGNNTKRNSSFLKVLPHMFLKSGISFSPDSIDCPWFYGWKSDFKLFPANIKNTILITPERLLLKIFFSTQHVRFHL